MTSLLKGLFFLATMMVWSLICIVFFIEALGTGKTHFIRDFPTWFDWTMLITSLNCCSFSIMSIVEVLYAPKEKQTDQPTKAKQLQKQLKEAIAKEDYETATKIRNRINFLKQTS